MLVLGVDFETTGLSTQTDHITEVGAMLWDTDRRSPLNPMLSSFIKLPGVKLEPVITELTGITDDDLDRFGIPADAVLAGLVQLMNRADAIVAHNGNLFDKPLLLAFAARHGVVIPDKLWIDTTMDVEYPAHITTRKLTHLAAEHGFVNPFAHRALFDVSTMLQVAGRYDWAQMVQYAKAPTLCVRADVNYHQRELAKKRNFRFNGETKQWLKSIKDFQLDEEKRLAAELGFNLIIMQTGAV